MKWKSIISKWCSFLCATILLLSCSKYPIVFSKNNETLHLNYDIILNENKTFEEVSEKSNDTNSFHEKGVYSIKDSILILDYTNETFVKSGNVSILTNDTFLIVKYKETFLLYPFIRCNLHSITNATFMKKVINDYTIESFEKRIGVDFFQLKKGDLKQIYNGKSLLSPYYDKFIKVVN